MADTNPHSSEQIPVEADGISYSGIVWFGVVLTAITLACQALVAGMFWFMAGRAEDRDPPRAALAAAPGQRPPGPDLLAVINPQEPPSVYVPDEPANLRSFRQREDAELHSYGWVDRNAGTLRIPIDRAKDLLLERGLPVKGAPPAAEVKKYVP